MPCLFPMFSHEEFVNAYGVITLKKRPSFGLKNGLRLGTLSKAKAHRRRAGTVSEGFRRCAPTGHFEQCEGASAPCRNVSEMRSIEAVKAPDEA